MSPTPTTAGLGRSRSPTRSCYENRSNNRVPLPDYHRAIHKLESYTDDNGFGSAVTLASPASGESVRSPHYHTGTRPSRATARPHPRLPNATVAVTSPVHGGSLHLETSILTHNHVTNSEWPGAGRPVRCDLRLASLKAGLTRPRTE